MAATGTHPWASYLDQRIIDTEHYNRLRDELRWVAQRNNTWSLHLHMGIRGADRAIAVCDHLRGVLPTLLALSANSPFLDGQDTGLHSVRTEIFTRTFPRCGIHEPFRTFAKYADFVDVLVRTGSIVESTQLWWSVRPHHSFGTVELRICDAQSRGDESFALAALIAACIAQTALDHDARILPEPQRHREIEENLWRAIRYGMDGRMIDFDLGGEIPTRAAVERLIEWSTPAREALGLEVELPAANGAQRARQARAARREHRRDLWRDDRRDPSHLRRRARSQLIPPRFHVWRSRPLQAGAEQPAEPTEEELRAQIEEGLRKVRVEDVLLESVVTILNLTARRIAKEDERDLDQARLGIEAVRALVDLLPSRGAAPGSERALGAPGALRAAPPVRRRPARRARAAVGERASRRLGRPERPLRRARALLGRSRRQASGSPPGSS